MVISFQPPNGVVAWVTGAMVAGLAGLWFGWMRRRFRLPAAEATAPSCTPSRPSQNKETD